MSANTSPTTRLPSRWLYWRRRSTVPYDGFCSEPTESGAIQRVVMPAYSNACPVGTRNGRFREDERNVRLARVPLFQLNVPPSCRPKGNSYESAPLVRCLIRPGWVAYWFGARGSRKSTSPWKSALPSEFELPLCVAQL